MTMTTKLSSSRVAEEMDRKLTGGKVGSKPRAGFRTRMRLRVPPLPSLHPIPHLGHLFVKISDS